MSRTRWILGGLLLLGLATIGPGVTAQTSGSVVDAPQYTGAGELIRPANFREWIFLSAGLGMTYAPQNQQAAAGASSAPPSFTNVYVNPSSYRKFLQTGTWPDPTMFILEIRGSASEGSINKGGHYQTSLVSIEAEVKDGARFQNKWAYFNFGPTGERATALPTTAACYACHSSKAAVENTFVQFYPTLMDVARRLGTVNRAYTEGKASHP